MTNQTDRPKEDKGKVDDEQPEILGDGEAGCIGCSGESLCTMTADPAAMEAALSG